MRPDDDLRGLFRALRERDQRETTGFAQVRSRPRDRRPPKVARWALVAVGIALLALLVARLPRPTPSVPSLTEWRAPTDFLLKTPGLEVLTLGPGLGRGSWSRLRTGPPVALSPERRTPS